MDITVNLENVSAKNWSSLRLKILLRIFQFVAAKEENATLCNLALVCKTWLYPARSILYSHVIIKTLSQLCVFDRTVENSAYLGRMVKVFYLDIHCPEINHPLPQDMDSIVILDFLTPLLSTHLPNLEEFRDSTFYSFTATVDALLGSGLKRLKLLQKLDFNCRETEIANYIVCCFLMKNRLENMLIASNSFFEKELGIKQLFFDRLYNNLYQFEKLKSIYIYGKTNSEIQILEHVVGSCTSLVKIDFYSSSLGNEANDIWMSNNNNVPMDAISKFTPATNVKSLKTNVKLPHNLKLLVYVIHKFSQHHTLTLNMENDLALIQLTQPMMTELLDYLSNINSFSVRNIRVNQDTITETIGSYWNSISTRGSKHVEFIYRQNDFGILQTLLDLSKRADSFITTTSFTYYGSAFSWGQTNKFMKKNGEFICEIRVAFESDIVKFALQENFLMFTLLCCPNIQRLHFQQCNLKLIAPYSRIDLSKRLSIQELYLDYCNLYTGFLESWSLLLPHIKQLRLRKIKYILNEVQSPNAKNRLLDQPILEIVMPSTEISLIVLEGDYLKEQFHLRVFVVTHGTHYYYQCYPSDNGNLNALTEAMYARWQIDVNTYLFAV